MSSQRVPRLKYLYIATDVLVGLVVSVCALGCRSSQETPIAALQSGGPRATGERASLAEAIAATNRATNYRVTATFRSLKLETGERRTISEHDDQGNVRVVEAGKVRAVGIGQDEYREDTEHRGFFRRMPKTGQPASRIDLALVTLDEFSRVEDVRFDGFVYEATLDIDIPTTVAVEQGLVKRIVQRYGTRARLNEDTFVFTYDQDVPRVTPPPVWRA